MKNKCYFCINTETKYCPLCRKWMCDDCRKNYPQRIEAMLKEKGKIIKKEIKNGITRIRL